ncbi:MAG: helix-turn-helix transcriptional regulator [Comamonas sp.]|nr:helix-turn-helix transcriptional regulator [Comamonas sp.]
MDIGSRLREERERLGMTQEAFGQAGGVLKRALIRYEKGERAPDATFLAALAAAGVDVLYVLTGQRMGAAAAPQPAPVGPVLSRRALAVADHFDNTSDEGKKIIEAAAFAAAQPAAKRGKAA